MSRLTAAESEGDESQNVTLRARRLDWLLSAIARSGRNTPGAGLGQLTADSDGFLDRGQGLFPPTQLAQAIAEINHPSGALAVVGRVVSQRWSTKVQAQQARRRDTGWRRPPA